MNNFARVGSRVFRPLMLHTLARN